MNSTAPSHDGTAYLRIPTPRGVQVVDLQRVHELSARLSEVSAAGQAAGLQQVFAQSGLTSLAEAEELGPIGPLTEAEAMKAALQQS